MNFEPLTQFLDSLIPYGVPGADMLIMQNHRPLYRHRAGWRDREAQEPIRGDELYFLYSCSKVATVVAAMQLLEKGKFLLTDPLCEYMPEWRDVLVRDADGGAHRAQNPILIRHLFSMTAGLDYEMDRPAIRRVREETAGACPTRAIARALSEKPLSFEPGAHWQYSLCHDVLAALVEVVSGEKFSDYVTGHIFRPLGMTRTCYHLQPGMEKDLAAQYRYNDEKRLAERIAPNNSYEFGPEYDSGGAGVISCVDDYIRLADALACGGADGRLRLRARRAHGDQSRGRAALPDGRIRLGRRGGCVFLGRPAKPHLHLLRAAHAQQQRTLRSPATAQSRLFVSGEVRGRFFGRWRNSIF